MALVHGFDWAQGNATSRIEILRRLRPQDLREIALGCPWTAESERVMGWIMAQRGIDLATAVSVFLSAGPERFNDLAKRDVPAPHRPTARVLDNICLRINSGFYLMDVPAAPAQEELHDRLRRWVKAQTGDRECRRRGRWILDEQIVEELWCTHRHLRQAPRPEPERDGVSRESEPTKAPAPMNNGSISALLRAARELIANRGRTERAGQ